MNAVSQTASTLSAQGGWVLGLSGSVDKAVFWLVFPALCVVVAVGLFQLARRFL